MTIKGIDTTHHQLTGAMLKAAGYQFVCRYVQNFPGSTLDKEMRKTELVEKTAAGVRVVANWEWSAAPANSRSLGQADANRWLLRQEALGIPEWAPCYYSIDTGATAGSYNAYAQGWLDEIPRERLGVYGDGALFRQLKADGFIKYAWQSMSRSFPGNHHADGSWNHDGADIIQTGNGTLNGFSLDFDTAVVDDYGGFLLGEADPMTLAKADADIVWQDDIIPNYQGSDAATNKTTTALFALADARAQAILTRRDLAALKAQLAAVATAVSADLAVDKADAADDVTVDQIVAAVKTALPDTTAGGLTLEQVEQAVRAALAGATITPASPVA